MTSELVIEIRDVEDEFVTQPSLQLSNIHKDKGSAGSPILLSDSDD